MRGEQLQAKLQSALGSTYTLERALPRGGMSHVYVAIENALGRRVVIKVLAPELAATLSAERFKREITLAARLQHPHIVPLLSAGSVADTLYYTMPLVDGESLLDRIRREREMPIADVVRVLAEVASALAYAHDEGIIHRDIKPANVMFFHGQAVVLDFGIGRALTASLRAVEDASARITLSGTSLGTPTYIAPEQAAGDPALDHRADLYSVGVVAYEMLCGRPPFTGRNPQVVMAAHASTAPEPIERRRADVPAELASIVMRCLEKNPADRPRSAEEIVRSVTGAETKGPRRVTPRSVLPRIPAWVPWVLAAISTGAAVWLALRT